MGMGMGVNLGSADVQPLLVSAAWGPELERFRELLALGKASGEVLLAATGIGLVDAAIGMTRCLAEHAPAQVIAIGTAGAAPGSGLAVGDVVVGTAVRLVDAAVVEGRAAMPFGAEALRCDEAMLDVIFAAGARLSPIATTLGVTTDDALAKRLAVIAPVEHLEAYATARACAVLGVPCAIVLGIANVVGAVGREQWKANHVLASARAAEIAHAALPGLLDLRRSTRARSPA